MKKILLISAYIIFIIKVTFAQGYKNPILSGFYPDPSICRVDDDFYLVNSTFQYFPGIPIHHSKDLIHWEQIGNCIDRGTQMNLNKTGFTGGLYAPTIRYHKGIFYMINTNVSHGGNYYVTATNPAGPWSDPIWVNQGGIDPELFFDDDGKCYFISTDQQIKLREIDVKTGKFIGDQKRIWEGTGGRYPEGPHLYKKDGYYYLMIAEGGTEYGHKVTISRSHFIDGPYESNPANPILTHQCELGQLNPIQGTGHADLVQATDGTWWMVFLAFRTQSGAHHLLGRETFLAPVRWDKDAWPVVNGNGVVSLDMDCKTLPQIKLAESSYNNDFSEKKLGFEWCYLCNPNMKNYSLIERSGFLRLKASTISINEIDSPTFVGRRQQDINFRATTALDVTGLKDNGNAGLSVYMSNNYQYNISVINKKGQKFLTLVYFIGSMKHVEKEIELDKNKVFLRVVGNADYYTFFYSTDDKSYEKLSSIDTRFLSSETAGGFTGVFLGLFAQEKSENKSVADFDRFEYIPQ